MISNISQQIRSESAITAIVLVAGLSSRMGTSKVLLPFGGQTVIEQIIAVLDKCPLQEILVITGLEAVSSDTGATLIVLGDQPALERSVVEMLIAAYWAGQGDIVIPSYRRRRGHPLLIGRKHWDAILALDPSQILRNYIRSVDSAVYHVDVNTSVILRDMDTPAEYQRELMDFFDHC